MKKTIIIALLLHIVLGTMAENVVVNTEKKSHRVEGWGVSLCWWARMCGTWDEGKLDEIIDWLVSPEGLNYNVFRYNIGGGDDPQNRNCELHHMGKGKGLRAEMPGFKQYADSEYDWQADSAQTRIMLKIREHRPDAIFEAFSNSAPWYMTVSGCCAGNADAAKDNLRPDCHEAFVDYLVDVCKHYKDAYGITFHSLEPFNESLSNYWPQNGSQEGCHFDVATQVAVVKLLSKKLASSGLSTIISASDETNTRQSLEAFDGYGDALPMVSQWNTHTYSATIDERKQLAEKAAKHRMKLWMSETGSGGKGIDGNLKMLRRLFDDVNHLKPAVWCDWQYMEEKGDQWCLINGNFSKQEYKKVNNFFVRQQVTRFIKQGYSILDMNSDNASCSNVLAAVSPDDKEVVVVILNASDDETVTKLSLPFTPNSVTTYTSSATEHLEQAAECVDTTTLTVSLKPQSVKTYVIR